MLDEAYQALSELQDTHWWNVGARHIYRRLLDLGIGPNKGRLRMLDVGCGPGANLELLGEYGRISGLDISTQALLKVAVRPALGLVQASVDALPFAADSFDGVHLLGVIEHLDDDLAAFQEAVRVGKDGAAVVLLTSALPILWSHHDEANLHRRRYLRPQLATLFAQAGLRAEVLSYQNFFVFPFTLLVRIWQRFTSRGPRFDVGNPPEFINRVLISLVRLEAWMLGRVNLPIGVDLVALCRVSKKN
jgi:SAM-dependent methyltransferase